MNAWRVVELVLAVLTVLSALKFLIGLAGARAADALRRCGLCYEVPGAYWFKSGKPRGFWLCHGCARQKLGGFGTAKLLGSGELTPACASCGASGSGPDGRPHSCPSCSGSGMAAPAKAAE